MYSDGYNPMYNNGMNPTYLGYGMNGMTYMGEQQMNLGAQEMNMGAMNNNLRFMQEQIGAQKMANGNFAGRLRWEH